MEKFWVKLLSRNGEISSKRFLSLIGMLMLCIGFLANLFWGFKVDTTLFNSLETLVEIGMGTIVAEKFGKHHPELPLSNDDDVDDGSETKKDDTVDLKL